MVAAAEAAGLGCCPVGAIRNKAEAVGGVLHLPAPVFPYVGFAPGRPAGEGVLSPRSPLAATVHVDRFDDAALPDHVADTDRRRIAQKPFAGRRFAAEFGTAEVYGRSEDVAGFGASVCARGFGLD